MSTNRCFFFAGGGTGGHIYPALAVAESLRVLAPDCAIQFLCSTRAIDTQILKETPFPFTTLPAQGLSRHPLRWGSFASAFLESSRRVRDHIRAYDDAVLIGTGGFVAGPACWAAHRMNIPIVLINVDVVAGKANRLAARWAQDIFLQFNDAQSAFARFPGTLHTVGCPLRRDFLDPQPQRVFADLELDLNKKILLVTGASSGAQNINEAIIALLGKLKPFAKDWQVVHLTGHQHFSQVARAYEKEGLSHRVLAYYRHMADLLNAADLLVGRAGAVSVAEFAAAGVPAICLPYPYHRDRHQYLNAGKLVQAGAAIIVDDVADHADRSQRLWKVLSGLLTNDLKRGDMAQACERVAQPSAGQQIAEHLLASCT